MSKFRQVPFNKLCYGVKFKYDEAHTSLFVKIGHNLVAGWDATKADCAWVGQSLCAAFETDNELSRLVWMLDESEVLSITVPEGIAEGYMARMQEVIGQQRSRHLVLPVGADSSLGAVQPYQLGIYRQLVTDPLAWARFCLGEFKPEPGPDWSTAPPGATHAQIKYPKNVIWLKLGLDHEMALRWSWDRMAWVDCMCSSADRKESKYVVARPAPDETWSLTHEADGFTFDTLAELIQDNSGELRLDEDVTVNVGDTVVRAEKEYPDPATFIDADRVRMEIEEHMADNAKANGFAEVCDGYPAISDAANQELETFLEAWARKHCKPTFFHIRNQREHTITTEDLEQSQ